VQVKEEAAATRNSPRYSKGAATPHLAMRLMMRAPGVVDSMGPLSLVQMQSLNTVLSLESGIGS